jgi:hypothetical protein
MDEDDDESQDSVEDDNEFLKQPLLRRYKNRMLWSLGDENKVKWFTILIAGLGTFFSTFSMRMEERLTLTLIVVVIIYLFWAFRKGAEEQPEIDQGWCVTWIDRFAEHPYINWENNLRIVFCNFKRYKDGDVKVETVPYTEYYGVYTKLAISEFTFNPFINHELLKHLESEYERPVVWADGTDAYRSPLNVPPRRVNKAIQSGTKEARTVATKWLKIGSSG